MLNHLNMGARIILPLLTFFCSAYAQKTSNYYRLPQGIQKSQYSQTTILVKWKSDYQPSSSGRSSLSFPGVAISHSKSLSPAGASQKSAAWRGPRKSASKVDISKYERIVLQPNQNIEEVINKLYATGHFEIVEPEFASKMSFTPNDPSRAQQYYLDLINAYEAWDITQGSEEVVIAIIDSGGDLDHPDLVSNIYVNPGEIASNNIDDDSDGYIDNVSGWDYVGTDTLNIFDSNFIGDNDPNLKQLGDPDVLTHGVWVAGCASAAANNNVGIAGVGFKSKLLFTKHTADNQNPESLSVYFGYDGILYAANTLSADNVVRKIINCSWGGSFRSQIAQDIINYVTYDLGCLVIGAAGNENSQDPHFPSGYDNVLSVAATTQTDVKANFSNTGYTVDLTAPGVSILSTEYNNKYGTVQGTSFSCPIVSGAAALLWAHRPELSALQIAEQLRISADASIYTKNSSAQADKLGKGRLDIQKALTLQSPSIRATNPKLLNAQGGFAEPGQPANLYLDFTNYLTPSSSGLTVSVSSSSTSISFSSNQLSLGLLSENQTLTKNFPLTISSNVPENLVVNIRLSFSDGAYSDFQVLSFNVNPSFVGIDENQITTTLTSRGRIGFDNPDSQTNGNGFVFNDDPVLFEMGLIIGSSSSTISNNVRGINRGFDQDFTSVDRIRESIPGERSSSEIYGSFANATTFANASLLVSYRSLVRKDAPYDKFVILEYKVKNVSNATINDLRVGIFSDWDISGNGAQDAAAWNSEKKIGYVFPRVSNDLPHAGIQVLNRPANYFAIDNSQDIAGNPIGLYDGYTDAEKFTTLSTERLQAGISTNEGNDVSHVVSASPVTIGSNEEVTITFALHAANNLTELLESAAHADTLYNLAFELTKPVVVAVPTCYGDSATVNASGATNLKWYSEFTGGEPIATGSQIITDNLFNDTTFYVANADNTYESVRTKVEVELRAKPTISTSGSVQFCEGQSVTLIVAASDEYLWSNGATTQSIEVTAANVYFVTVRDNTLSCESSSEEVEVIVSALPTPNFTTSTQELTAGEAIAFTDESIDAVAWFWDFGDDLTSNEQNPTHTFEDGGAYEVILTITSAEGCQNSSSDIFDIITDVAESLSTFPVEIHPNPVKQTVTIEALLINSYLATIEVITPQGLQLSTNTVRAPNRRLKHMLRFDTLPNGVYLVKIRDGKDVVVRRIVKHN